MGVNGIYGLSGSGLDIESMVKVGMMGKQNEYDKLQQKYTKNEWVKASYIETYGTIQTFNNSTLSKYKMSNNMNAKNATSSQESVVTATANANAANMTHVVEVGQLASAAYLVGTQSLERIGDGSNETSVKLKDVLFYNLERINPEDDTESEGRAIKWKDSTLASDYANATDTAFSFVINDGVNGMMTNTNSDAVVVTANSDVAVGQTYKVNVTALAKPAEATVNFADISENTHVITTLIDKVNGDYNGYEDNFTLSNIQSRFEALLAEDGQFLSDAAMTFHIDDGENEKAVSITYAELLDANTTFNDIFAKIQNQLSDTNISLTFEDGDNGLEVHLLQKETGEKNTISMWVDSENHNNYMQSFVGLFSDAIDNVFNTEYPYKATYTPAEGTIEYTNEDGETVSESLNFDENNMAKFGDLTIVAKNLTGNKPAEITTVKPTEVSVTYQQILDGYTFNDLVSAINSAGTNVKAVYDSVQDTFSFYNKESGEKHQIGFNFKSAVNDEWVEDEVTTRTLNFFQSLGLYQSNDGELSDRGVSFDYDFSNGTSVAVTGQDAKVKIDGIDMSVDANTVNVAGVVYKFTGTNATTYTDNDGKVKVKSLDNKAQVVVSQDTNEVVENVKSFIEDYNKLLSTLQEKYNEKPYTTYKPLTDAQRAEMTDDQIEKWEEKAQAGMLYHDRTLGKIIDQMRDTVSETVYGLDSKYTNIFSIGISTTGTKGQLTLDEDKLRAALADDPDAVYNIFAKLDEGEKIYERDADGNIVYNEDGTQKYTLKERSSYNGIAQRLGDIFTAGMKSIKTRSGTSSDISEDSDLNNLLRELQTKISNFRTAMNAFEDALYKKYDKMEVALSTLGAQLNYVTSAFSS